MATETKTDSEKLVEEFNEWADERIDVLRSMPSFTDAFMLIIGTRIETLKSAKNNLERLAGGGRKMVKDLSRLKYLDMEMTNFGHSIDDGFEERLRDENCWGNHHAWNFCGDVWFEDGKFHENVYQYHVFQSELEAETLEELMKLVNAKYGED